MATGAELNYDRNATAEEMAETIFGDGVEVVDADYTGDWRSSAVYSGGDSIAPGATPGDSGIILSTGRADRYTNSSGDPNRSASQSTNTSGENNNSDFNEAAGTRTYDASYLDVTFIPDGDYITMQFVFASEEYPEYTSSIYQDFVGVWVNGEFVDVEFGNGDADPGNINSGTNENLYLDNTNDAYNTEMDGLTVTMTLTIPVNAGEENDIRIGIADVSDSSYDSNLLIAADSVQSEFIAMTDSTNLNPDGAKTIDVLANGEAAPGATLTITHINGNAAMAGTVVTLNTGQTVMLNADGTLTLTGDGDTEDFNFTYTATDGSNSDTGLVNVTSVPCFTAGTRIRTPYGAVPVEMLSPGDLVSTRDDGPQPLRWIGSRTVAAEGKLAPVLIRAGSFGSHRDLLVSPHHRVLLRGAQAELLFGEAEVFAAAGDLVNGRSVVQQPGGEVTYVHMLFDRHQVVWSEGLETESFLPGPQISGIMEQNTLQEICTLFPELDPETGDGYSPAARPALKGFEGQLLAAAS